MIICSKLANIINNDVNESIKLVDFFYKELLQENVISYIDVFTIVTFFLC